MKMHKQNTKIQQLFVYLGKKTIDEYDPKSYTYKQGFSAIGIKPGFSIQLRDFHSNFKSKIIMLITPENHNESLITFKKKDDNDLILPRNFYTNTYFIWMMQLKPVPW